MSSNMQSPQSADASRPRRQRRTLSCLPCRLSKLRCGRTTPCPMCIRHNREDRCRRNPPPVLASKHHVPASRNLRPKDLAPSGSASVADTTKDLPPLTPASLSKEDGGNASLQRGSPRGDGRGFSPHVLSQPQSQPHQADANSANKVSVASAVASRSHDACERTVLDETPSYWKRYLVDILPSQSQCDMFVSYFFENINWIYQAVHAPSLRDQHRKFWASEVDQVDLNWLALLYIILCLGAVYIPSEMAEAVGFEASDLPLLHSRWYAASRQALHAGGYDCKPTLVQLQVFLLSQLYWYATKNIEALNSHMGQAIRNAQALGLDKEAPQSFNCLEREMRHRIWWDLVSTDTFQSLCLGRPTLLQAHLSSVPFPSNCNDEDMSPLAVNARPITEPTEFSAHIFRARVFKVLSQLYIDNGTNLSSYRFVDEINTKLSGVLASVPWYLRDDLDSIRRRLPSRLAATLAWQRHILHSCVGTQRVRMYRPFLKSLEGDAWQRCVEASTGTLAIYKSLRLQNVAQFQRSQKMHVQAYQVFSAAVALATFLLVEMPSNAGVLRADIELVLDDLHSYSHSLDRERRMPLVSDGQKVIHRILRLYDARRRLRSRKGQAGYGDECAARPSESGDTPAALVPAIYSVFGGESTARCYLERCAIDYILNEPATSGRPVSSADPGGSGKRSQGAVSNVADQWEQSLDFLSAAEPSLSADDFSSDTTDMPAWDALFDSSNWGQWGELLLADLDTFMVTGTEGVESKNFA
ncbi:transcription factor [Fusarium beomiforme]|uniref:Transcription factor n=1 Tax=Fusarium beomiforme TaxID=44412 RepID=A0A9P5AYG1_9HYPO|nr:transcription factor [Fusarium beomiforme]